MRALLDSGWIGGRGVNYDEIELSVRLLIRQNLTRRLIYKTWPCLSIPIWREETRVVFAVLQWTS